MRYYILKFILFLILTFSYSNFSFSENEKKVTAVDLIHSSENSLKNLDKREDGKFEILDMKLDTRKTKNLDKTFKNNVDVVENEKKAKVIKNQIY